VTPGHTTSRGWGLSPHTPPRPPKQGPKPGRGRLQTNPQPGTSPAARRADSERKLNTTHRSNQETINSSNSSKHAFSFREAESAQFCGHRRIKGKALLPELTTLQWWPSTEVPSAQRTGAPAAAPAAGASPGTAGASPPATLWFADQERQLPTGIGDLGLLRARLQRSSSLETPGPAQHLPSLGQLTLGCGIASGRGGPGRAARCPQPPGSARSPCSQRHPPSACALPETPTLAPRWVEAPATARSRRAGSARTAWL